MRGVSWFLAVTLAPALALAGQAPPPTAAAIPSPSPAAFLPEAAPEALRLSIRSADEALGALKRRLTARLMQEMEAGGPLRAIGVCRDEAQGLTAEVGRAAGVQVGRTSHRLRNPGNRPPAWAEPFVQAAAGRKAAEVQAVAVELGDRVGVLRPIAMGAMCAKCHGGADQVAAEAMAVIREAYPLDQALGFVEGDLRGFAWAEARITGPLAATALPEDPLVTKGRALFAEVNPRCTVCHTLEGEGNPASVLDGIGSRLSREQIQAWLRTPAEVAKAQGKTRKPAMVPYPQLDDAELEALAAFVTSLEKR